MHTTSILYLARLCKIEVDRPTCSMYRLAMRLEDFEEASVHDGSREMKLQRMVGERAH